MKRNTDRNPELTQRFEFRPGVNSFPDWKGVVREPGDPGSIPPNAFWNAINVRFKGSSVVNRGGQDEYANLSSLCVTGIREFEAVEGGNNVVLTGPATEAYLLPSSYDPTAPSPIRNFGAGGGTLPASPPCQFVFPTAALDSAPPPSGPHPSYVTSDAAKVFALNCFFRANGKNYALADGRLDTHDTVNAGINEITVTALGIAFRPVMALPTACSSVCVQREREVNSTTGTDEVNDVVYLGDYAGHLYRWSSVSGFTTENHGGAAQRSLVISYQGLIYVATKNSLRKRASAGSFSSVSLPVYPAGDTFEPLCTVEVGNVLYIGGALSDSNPLTVNLAYWDPYIISYNGTTATSAHYINFGMIVATAGITSMAFGYGTLYYCYHNRQGYASSVEDVLIGTFDGSVWTDNVVGLAIQLGSGFLHGGEGHLFFNGKDLLLSASAPALQALQWGMPQAYGFGRSLGSTSITTLQALSGSLSAFPQPIAGGHIFPIL